MLIADSRFIAPVTVDQLKREYTTMCSMDPWKVTPNPTVQQAQSYLQEIVEMTKLLIEFCLTERGFQVRRDATILDVSRAAYEARVYVAPYCHQNANWFFDIARGMVNVAQVHPLVIQRIGGETGAFYNEIAVRHGL